MKRTVLAVVTTVALLAGCSSVDHRPRSDARFIHLLGSDKPPAAQPSTLIAIGKRICSDLGEGVPWLPEIIRVTHVRGMTAPLADDLMRGAVSVYCPRYAALLPSK